MQINKPRGIAREALRHELTGVPTSTWYDLQAKGLAPKPIHLGPRSRGWLISELEDWVQQRAAARGDTWQPLGNAAARVIEKTGDDDVRCLHRPHHRDRVSRMAGSSPARRA